jgi:spore maturation protein CgeB
MRILYVAPKFDYGRPERGLSFEHYNFFDTLQRMGHDLVYFDFMSIERKRGRAGMNRRLLEVVRNEPLDLMFTVLYKDQLDRAVVRDISDSSGVVTLNWFCDDDWRFETFSRHWAPCFNWVVTTAASALPKYAALGYENVVKSQWACNHNLYRRLDGPLRFNVTFVGQSHGPRRAAVEASRRGGLDIDVWGTGWTSSRLEQEEMISVFCSSRINLNFSNLPDGQPSPMLSWLEDGWRRYQPRGKAGRAAAAAIRRAVRFLRGLRRERPLNLTPDSGWSNGQIKGRNFEVPGCGGFLLTSRAAGLEQYYELGREVACFESVPELIEKAQFYLAHEEERATIAEAGYRRTRRDHTYERRLNEVFARIGIDAHNPAEAAGRLPTAGGLVEVE